jgi:iron complex outermembrane receptor protein
LRSATESTERKGKAFKQFKFSHLKPLGLFFLLLFCAVTVRSQTDTTIQQQLHEVEVTSTVNTYSNESVLNISNLSISQMRQNGSFNISDALSSVPGISQINTGVGISKPVIRGLYGNRVQTVFSGLRFDNQQWQDEHGLGITDIGIDRIEIIKGPASLLYGSEAVGGVINIIEEKKAEEGKVVGDFNTRFLSNTLGNATDIGFKGNKNDKNWRIRAGFESDADYSDGSNARILNSRFNGYYFKSSYGFQKKNWSSENNYSGSLNQFGFIMADNRDAKKLDDRFSRTLDGPFHKVFLNILSSENIFKLKQSILKLNIGVQSNIRMEDEGGGEISLNMHLSSLIYNLQWIKVFESKTELIISNQGIIQNNTNYGKRKIVPDANMSETGLSIFLNQKIGKLILEGGIGSNFRHIKTFETENVNTPDRDIHPFNRTTPAINGMLGATINPNKFWNIKFCGSTGFRTGNLAELSSNGLHEGIYQYEIGDPKLKAEQNYNSEVAINYSSEQLAFSVAAFNNYFNNYIYLSPTNETFYGIQVFRYKQNNANLYGGEAALTIKPNVLKGFELKSNFSTVTGLLYDGSYLPFIPANKIHSEIKYSFDVKTIAKDFYVLAGNDYVFAQNNPANHETKTDAYYLFNAGLGSHLMLKKQPINFSFICNNLLNATYYDHLSRFKYYGIHNIGRNIVLNIQIPFNLK